MGEAALKNQRKYMMMHLQERKTSVAVGCCPYCQVEVEISRLEDENNPATRLLLHQDCPGFECPACHAQSTLRRPVVEAVTLRVQKKEV